MKDKKVEFIVRGIPSELYPQLVKNEDMKLFSKYYNNEGKNVRDIPLCDYLTILDILINTLRRNGNINKYKKEIEPVNLLEKKDSYEAIIQLIAELKKQTEKCNKILNKMRSLIERINAFYEIK